MYGAIKPLLAGSARSLSDLALFNMRCSARRPSRPRAMRPDRSGEIPHGPAHPIQRLDSFRFRLT
jgi:hypothetical protein